MMGRDDDREQRIAKARAALAARYAADPVGVDRFNARTAKLDAARKRERERVDHLVQGQHRPRTKSGKGRGKVKTPVPLTPSVDAAVTLREEWSHKQGTPETLARAGSHTDSLDQMERNGTIDKEQREYAAQIANVHRSIEADVAVSVASMEARVDNDGRGGDRVAESVRRVRLHRAYTLWRARLPSPKQAVLDMIVGDAIGYTVAATRYRMGERRAKRMLLDALMRWPSCVDAAYRLVSSEDVERANAA